MQRAVSFYGISNKIFPFWKTPKGRLITAQSILDSNKADIEKQKRTVKIENENVSVVSKNIFKTPIFSHRGPNIVIAGILKNNSDTGIPSVKTTKIVLLQNNKAVATKDFKREFLVVSKGEVPFQLFLSDTPDNPVPAFDDFSVDFEIPPFIPNEEATRLKIIDSKILSASPRIGGSIWDYKVIFTVLNDTDFTVSNIYRLTFLKYRDNHLGEYLTSGPVYTDVEVSKPSIVDLDNRAKKEYEKPILKSKEKREFEFNLVVDEEYQGRYKPNDVELAGYFVGVMEKN